MIAYTGYDDKDFTSHLSSLYLMDSSGGAKRLLAGNLNNSPGEITWAPDNSGVYFTVGENGSDSIYFAPVTGAAAQALGQRTADAERPVDLECRAGGNGAHDALSARRAGDVQD